MKISLELENKIRKAKAMAQNAFDNKLYDLAYKRRKVVRTVFDFLAPIAGPEKDEIVKSLIMHTNSLELVKGQYFELAPVKGTCGVILLSGNSLPVFQYTMFEKELMEFIRVRVEVSPPHRIQFVCQIDSEGTEDPKDHGKLVECKDKYQAPFHKLALHLFNYFPYTRKTNAHGSI